MRQMFIVNHAQSCHQVAGLTGGWHDTELTEEGRRQAGRIGRFLGGQLGAEPVALYSSDLQRAAQTAGLIAAETSWPGAVLLPELRELCHGEAEGRPKEWLIEHAAGSAEDIGLDCRLCPGAETLRACAQRIYAAMETMLGSPCSTLIVVSHSFVLTYLVMAWLKIPYTALGPGRLSVAPASVTLLREGEMGWRTLDYLARTDFHHAAAAGERG